jgi:hypothetical protein
MPCNLLGVEEQFQWGDTIYRTKHHAEKGNTHEENIFGSD